MTPKKILVLHYSQSGQLSEVARQFVQPLMDKAEDVHVTFERIEPEVDYPFPWPFFDFLDAFPESVYLDPPPLQPSTLKGDERFDLVILAYQVWFLSPSLPVTGFLKSELAARLLKDTPVVTLIACRNMWLMAQEQVKKMLDALGARLVGNVALVDAAGSAGSFLATPLWVLTGNKGPHWGGLIPRAGVAEEEIRNCSRFGARILEVLRSGQPLDEQLLAGLGAVHVNPGLISSERTARRGFLIWGRWLRRIGPPGSFRRKPVLLVYVTLLIAFIVTFIPLSALLKTLFAPFQRERIRRQVAYFGRPSGS